MEAILTKKMNIDKTNWTLVKFGDVVYEPKQNMKDIISDGIEHVVGLEHITTDDIHLRNSAGIEESTTFTKKFAIGDVLFGRRRAYLRKAAQAPFGGICSGDITVFRAKKGLLPELLPFIVNNEKFFDYAIKHSAGGLSPRVKFKDLADYEFLLPPKDQQAQLSELLWAMDEVIEREIEVLENQNKFIKTFIYTFLQENKKKPLIALGKVCTPKQWKTIPKKDLSEEGYLVYGGNGLIGKYTEYTHEDSVIAIACRGEYCGNIHYTEPKSYVTGNSMCIDNLDSSMFNQKYLFYILYFMNLDSIISGSAQPQIIKSAVERFKVNVVSMKSQNDLVDKMDKLMENIKSIKVKNQSSQSLQKSIINQIF
jgi:type I restriction enzyme S subunit